MSASLLQASGLEKSFGGVLAVGGVDLAVDAGEVVALIGPNGAGKSTLFNLLSGQLRADRGDIRFNGQPIGGLSPLARWRLGIGCTFQITEVFTSLTVAENIELARQSRRGSVFRVQRRLAPTPSADAVELLQRVGLDAAAQTLCTHLPYGDRKRLEWALALAQEPVLLLLDEPTAGMAPAERQSLMRGIVELAREAGLAVLFTEHDMDVVFDHADRIIVLDRGLELAAGSPDAVRADARVRSVYLGDLAPGP